MSASSREGLIVEHKQASSESDSLRGLTIHHGPKHSEVFKFHKGRLVEYELFHPAIQLSEKKR